MRNFLQELDMRVSAEGVLKYFLANTGMFQRTSGHSWQALTAQDPLLAAQDPLLATQDPLLAFLAAQDPGQDPLLWQPGIHS